MFLSLSMPRAAQMFLSFALPNLPAMGTNNAAYRSPSNGLTEEEPMPVILLWGIPTMFVIVGGGYWLMHMHH